MDSKLNSASNKFFLSCLFKLAVKEKQGFVGWDDPSRKEHFEKRIRGHCLFKLDQRNLVNITNYCNFLWNLIERTKEGGEKSEFGTRPKNNQERRT